MEWLLLMAVTVGIVVGPVTNLLPRKKKPARRFRLPLTAVAAILLVLMMGYIGLIVTTPSPDRVAPYKRGDAQLRGLLE